MRRFLAVTAIVCVSMFLTAEATAGVFNHHPCYQPCGPCYVPKMVTEKRIVKEVVCKPVTKQRTIQVCRRIPETTMQTRLCTVMVPQKEMRTVCYTVCKPVWREVEQTICVPVPRVVVQKGSRTVCRRVPVKSTRIVCVDQGHWGTKGCGCCKVWVPNVVQQEVPCTRWKIVTEQVPFEYKRTVYDQRLEKRMIKVCDYTYEKVTREVPVTCYVPKTEERQFPVVNFKVVTEPKVINYIDYEQHVVEREIDVCVCKWVLAETAATPVQK